MVSHHVEEIPVGFTHVLMLRDGGVVAQGPIDIHPDRQGTWGVRSDYDSSSRTMVDASVRVGQHTDIERTAEETAS